MESSPTTRASHHGTILFRVRCWHVSTAPSAKIHRRWWRSFSASYWEKDSATSALKTVICRSPRRAPPTKPGSLTRLTMKYPHLISLCLALSLGLTGLRAADSKYGLAADNHIRAQQLVNAIMSSNPGLVSVGMHCTAPGGTRQTIVASTLNVIGKPSDPPDIDVGTRGETIISPNLKI